VRLEAVVATSFAFDESALAPKETWNAVLHIVGEAALANDLIMEDGRAGRRSAVDDMPALWGWCNC